MLTSHDDSFHPEAQICASDLDNIRSSLCHLRLHLRAQRSEQRALSDLRIDDDDDGSKVKHPRRVVGGLGRQRNLFC